MFNSCRDSGDHGPFNSWDRQPFLTDVRNGTPSLIPAWNELHHNLVISNYNANGGCFDNDDGRCVTSRLHFLIYDCTWNPITALSSAWYNIHHNWCAYGGHKSTNGYSKRTFSNLNVYPQVYGAACLGAFGLPRPTADGEFNEGFW